MGQFYRTRWCYLTPKKSPVDIFKLNESDREKLAEILRDIPRQKEQEKALQETILRVKEHSIEEATKNLDPTDIQGLQRLMNEKRKMQDLRTLHISIN